MPAASRKFGRKANPEPLPVVPFSVVFDHEGEEIEHHFTARPQITYGDMVGLKKHEQDEQGAVLPYLDRIIRRSLRNDDGTPLKWTPLVKAGHFTSPDGNETPVADLPKYTAHEAGSSRRRWSELIESEEDIVDFDQVMEVFEYLAEVASDRPTERPQRS